MRCAKLLGLFALAITLSAADSTIGAWKLNVAKSKYSPGPPPQSGTVTYEETADGIRRSGETIAADGSKTSFEYTAKYDGKEYPVKGSDLFDTIVLKRVNDRTVEATLKKSGKDVSHARRVVSKEGKTMTISTTGKNAKGQKMHNVAFYEKQ
jgi:hypothetical protein